jgi:hypothetical protein
MTVAELLARADSRELTEWGVYFEQKHDEELYFHEHPRTTYAEYLEARERREEHARRAGQRDTLGDDGDEDDDRDEDDDA